MVPADDSLCYSSTGFQRAHDFVMDLVQALEAQQLEVEHYYPELGHGQQEVVIRHAPALRAADNHLLYRETVRGVAFRRGVWASLAPKPIADQAGNGTHLHGSLFELGPDGAPTGRNVFADASDRYGLSETGYHFIGGLLAHLPALTALTCGSVNSYRRLAPQMWSSAYTVYGMDNREAAVRIASVLRGDPASSVNLELKPSDSSANPYLALGAFIYAGLDGIRGKLDPGEAVNVDPATLSDAERARLGARRLPDSLDAALNALEADDLLMTALGPLRSRAYLAVKRSEAADFAAHDAAYECFHHFTKILGRVMKTVTVDVRQWLLCTAVALSVVAVAEIRKAILGGPRRCCGSAGDLEFVAAVDDAVGHPGRADHRVVLDPGAHVTRQRDDVIVGLRRNVAAVGDQRGALKRLLDVQVHVDPIDT